MFKDYRISKHNSTACGYPGRFFDWNLFCWDGSEVEPYKGIKAPLPLVDDYLITENCQYLHIPYDWKNQGTIYRVRPNESMYAGKIYRGRLITSIKAIKKEDGWYWRLYQ